jgi:nucleotide-binding universal stress UspA family protein
MIRLKHILAPTDFSEHNQFALKYACAFADQFGAVIHLLNVVPIMSSEAMEWDLTGVTFQDMETQTRDRAVNQLEDLRNKWAEYSFPIDCTVVSGTPFVEIVRYARENDIDLIVLGTHGRGALAHMLMGSVAERVVRKAPCPVLTVKHPEHEFVMP